MRQCTIFSQTEFLLLTAIQLPGQSIKSIAEATGIKANTLYKWKTTPVHLSPVKADRLLSYFIEYEPSRLELADTILHTSTNAGTDGALLQNPSTGNDNI